MVEKDFMDTAVEEYLGQPAPVTPPPVAEQGAIDTPPAQIPATPTETPPAEAAPVAQSRTTEEVLTEFNKLAGTSFDNLDKVKSFVDAYSKYPEIEEQVKVIPELVDAFSKIENPLSYFRDETDFKVSQLLKDQKYQGKENIINGILRGNLEEVPDVKVIELASQLNAKQGVRNPLRAELKSIGVDPDDVLEDYESLDDDTKDLLKIRADQYRDQLKTLGSDIKPPSFEGTVIERLINQKKAASEEREVKMGKVVPVAKAIISEVKEIPITDDFKLKLELTADEINAYSSELSEAIVAGKFNVSTEEGKKQVYGAILDMIRADYFDKAVTALSNYLVSKTQEDMRREFNNETPLKKSEPMAVDASGKDVMTLIAEKMVAQGF